MFNLFTVLSLGISKDNIHTSEVYISVFLYQDPKVWFLSSILNSMNKLSPTKKYTIDVAMRLTEIKIN